MTLANIIGDNIRGFRNKRKWSQFALGAHARLHGNYIGEVERAEKNITFQTLWKIARALKTNPHFFLVEGAYRMTPDQIMKKISSA